MEIDKKMVAAIGAAMASYVQEEKSAERAARKSAERPAANLWSQSGRQEIMRNRQMWQLRIVPG